MGNCIEGGSACVIENVENEMDPMLDPVLEKQYEQVGRNKKLKLGDADLEWDDNFRLYIISRLANPSWSPELSAKTTIIDFTVTQTGLGEQLLATAILCEKKHLEDAMQEITQTNTKNQEILKGLDSALLEKLGSCKGNILEDKDLIDTLTETKTKSKEVEAQMAYAKERQAEINIERMEFKAVSEIGSVLYFCIVDMVEINCMYNSSLKQFMTLYISSMVDSRKPPEEGQPEQETADRVQEIIEAMKFIV